MSKLRCKMCGSPIEEKICKYCKHEIEDDIYEEYKKTLIYLKDYDATIKSKTIAGEKLTEDEDLKLRVLLKYESIPDDNFYDVPILYHFLTQNKIFSYDTFEEYVKVFIKKTMRDFAKTINPEWNTSYISVSVEKLKPGWRGAAIAHYFYRFDSDEVKRLYEGSLGALATTLHEMYHGGHDLMITNNMVNPLLIQIIKEDIIREDDVNNNGADDLYYTKNYKSISSEIFAQQMAISFLEYLLKQMELNAPPRFIEYEKSLTDPDISNQNRIITINGEEKVMTVDEIFDERIKALPDKLKKIPQLNLEYINDNGTVRRKSTKELKETLEALEKPDAIAYVQYILDNKKNLA